MAPLDRVASCLKVTEVLWVYRFGTLLLLSSTIPVSGSTSKTARARVYLHVAGVPTAEKKNSSGKFWDPLSLLFEKGRPLESYKDSSSLLFCLHPMSSGCFPGSPSLSLNKKDGASFPPNQLATGSISNPQLFDKAKFENRIKNRIIEFRSLPKGRGEQIKIDLLTGKKRNSTAWTEWDRSIARDAGFEGLKKSRPSGVRKGSMYIDFSYIERFPCIASLLLQRILCVVYLWMVHLIKQSLSTCLLVRGYASLLIRGLPPIVFLERVFSKLFDQDFSEAVSFLLSGGEFDVRGVTTPGSTVRFLSGTCVPVFTNYAVLGDDVVIADENVATRYKESLDLLQVVISKEKSLISRSGSAEFAKNFRVRDLTVDLSPVSIKALLNTFHPYGLMAVAHRYSVRDLLCRLGGAGYRVLARLDHRRYSRLVVMGLKLLSPSYPLYFWLGKGRPLSPEAHGRLVRLLRAKLKPRELVLPPDELCETEESRDFLEYSLFDRNPVRREPSLIDSLHQVIASNPLLSLGVKGSFCLEEPTKGPALSLYLGLRLASYIDLEKTTMPQESRVQV
ncbi:RNA-dependent RNA polymerase, mitoviral [Tanacetum coccineum]